MKRLEQKVIKPSECISRPLERLVQCNRNVNAPEYRIHLCCLHLAAVQPIDLGLQECPRIYFNETPIPAPSSSHRVPLLYYMYTLRVSPNLSVLPPSLPPSLYLNRFSLSVCSAPSVDLDMKYFWKWTAFEDYVLFCLGFAVLCAVVTLLLLDISVFVEILGFLAVAFEAMLGLPQLLQNFHSHTTKGMRYDTL